MASIPRIAERFSFISIRRRPAWQAIDTWSSWFAEVGVESTVRGLASERFSLSASWSYSSGKLVTVPIGKYEVEGRILDVYGERNNFRLSNHHRADISANWFREKENGLKHTWTVAIYNVYLHKNPEYLYIDPISNTAKEISLFSIIPSVTYFFEF